MSPPHLNGPAGTAPFPVPARKRRRSAHAVIAGLSAAALLALGGCAQDPKPAEPVPAASAEPAATAAPSDAPAPTEDGSKSTTAPTSPAPAPSAISEEQMTDLMLLHARLKTELGAVYSDAWIEDGQLYVAVTAPETEATVYGAGAVPVHTAFSEQQLHDAAVAFKAWLATDAAPPVQLHWLGTSGRTGSITVRVPADEIQALSEAVSQQRPAGDVDVIVEESGGPATPLAPNAP